MKALHPIACDFMVYIYYIIDLKFIFQTIIMNFRTQHFASRYVNKHPVFLHVLAWVRHISRSCSSFSFSIINLFSKKLFYTFFAYLGDILPATFSSSSLDIKFLRGIFNSFGFCNKVFLLIYFFVTFN